MKLLRPTVTKPSTTAGLALNVTRFSEIRPSSAVGFPMTVITPSRPEFSLAMSRSSLTSPSAIASDIGSGKSWDSESKLEAIEEIVEKAIYGCRFMAILGVSGSLIGSFLCFIKGCSYVVSSFMEYFVNRGKVITLLVEAIDVYLLGTVMLVFGMGLYELFVSTLDIANSLSDDRIPNRSSLFGLFALKERPTWLEIQSVNELKTKLGHVIVMLLLIGLVEKSKKAIIQSPLDLLCFTASILLSSGSLYLLSKLNGSG